MYFLVLEDSGGLICWVHSCYLSICISVISNRCVLCMVFIVFVDILVCIGEILINLQYFLRFSLYILWNPWNPYYLSLSGILSSDLCIQVSGCWLQEKRGRDHCFVFVYLFSWNKLIRLLHSLHCTFIW